MRFFTLWVLVGVWAANSVCAQDKVRPHLAVLPLSGDHTVSSQQLTYMTGKLSGALLSSQEFIVLERSKMDFILQEQGFQQSGACNSNECQVQMGQLLGVDNLVTGSLVNFGNKYALHLDFIDVSTGKIEWMADVERSGKLEDIYGVICQDGANELLRGYRVAHGALAPGDSLPSVSAGAIPEAAPGLSWKRKLAVSLWGAGVLAGGTGYWFNAQGNDYADDYDAAAAARDPVAVQDAYDNTQSADLRRNVAYGVSVSALVVGAVLWFWPE